MAGTGYNRMELFRLSPNTGDILRRLNVFEGQILHGKIFKIELMSGQQEGAGNQSAGQTFLAKIALGSHLIEAIIDEALPIGAKVSFQVLDIGEDSFLLQLLSVEEPSVSQSSSAAESEIRSDIAEWSEQVVDKLESGQIFKKEPVDNKAVVERPEISSLPKQAATVIRAAITQGFIDPVTFEANLPTGRVAMHAAVEELSKAIENLIIVERSEGTLPTEAGKSTPIKQIAESVRTLIEIIRPMIASLPSTRTELTESVASIVRDLIHAGGILRPTIALGFAGVSGGNDESVSIPSSRFQSQPSAPLMVKADVNQQIVESVK